MSGEMAEQEVDDAITYGDDDNYDAEEENVCDFCGEASPYCGCNHMVGID